MQAKPSAMNLRRRFWEWRIQLRLKRDEDVFSPQSLGEVDPRDLHFTLDGGGDPRLLDWRTWDGMSRGGGWDGRRQPVAESGVYRAIHEHFTQNQPWQETALLEPCQHAAAPGESCSCAHGAAGESYLRRLDEAHADAEVLQRACADPGHGIALAIGREGNPLILRGAEWAALAGLRGCKAVPVRIAFVHPQWQRFRKAVMNYAELHQGKIYQRITHPDLGRVPSIHGDERLALLSELLPVQRGALLDIGAHWGYFCHGFERLGFQCHAVDHSSKNAFFMQRIRRAMQRSFSAWEGSVFDYPPATHFSVVLALNIFHHFLKQEQSYENLKLLLKRLSMDCLFFEPHRPEEFTRQQVFKNLQPDEFAAFIAGEAGMAKIERIGAANDQRLMYRLTR
jgi:hypothetical protein